MAINVVPVNFTEQGMRNIKESPQRAQAFRELCRRNEVRVRDIFWTIGRYDMVAIVEGAEETMAAVGLSVAKLGNIRTETLRGMDAETFERVLQKVA